MSVELKQDKFMDKLSEKGLTIPEFARLSGINYVTVYRVVNCERKPGAAFIAATMRAFDTSDMNEFFIF